MGAETGRMSAAEPNLSTVGGTVTIPVEEYARLKEDQEFLEALRTAGVDNWDGYSEAFAILRGEWEAPDRKEP